MSIVHINFFFFQFFNVFYGLISQDWPCTSDSSSSQILGLQACSTMQHHAQVTIHSKHKICYSIMYCNSVKMDFVDFKFFAFLLSRKIVHIPLLEIRA